MHIEDTFHKIFRNKNIFITGHTGFIGTWLSLWLTLLGANVTGYSLGYPTRPSFFEIISLENEINHIEGDLQNFKKISQCINECSPDIVFHLGAQSLVRKSYAEPLNTLNTNILGTANLLESVRNCKNIKVTINMTSDKCYDNTCSEKPHSENDPMGGFDPYSASKGASELITSSYRNSFFNSKNSCKIATVRCGNVIGGGDWSDDRIIPDSIKALTKKQNIKIRNPAATRPWQYVLESISGILWLTTTMLEEKGFDEAWNFGPNANNTNSVSVEKLVKKMITIWNSKNIIEMQNTNNEFHESKLLVLDSSKANTKLKWKNVCSIDEAITETVEWYKKYEKDNEKMNEFSINQIKKYVNLAGQRDLIWTK
ncbi:CDP-glucose 4,6-dehydratase [Candidatus Nitrosopelagicus sp.]|nr:CDP-glucose 4,6-dehydratase [Candidatus Nitrosopelagicus sp.]